MAQLKTVISSWKVVLSALYTQKTQNCKFFFQQNCWENRCPYMKLLKESLQLWKKVVVCVWKITAFFADSFVVCEGLYSHLQYTKVITISRITWARIISWRKKFSWSHKGGMYLTLTQTGSDTPSPSPWDKWKTISYHTFFPRPFMCHTYHREADMLIYMPQRVVTRLYNERSDGVLRWWVKYSMPVILTHR